MANNVNLSFPSAYFQQFIDKNGKPLVGGKLYTYIAGSSTAIATYKKIGSVDATNTNTNPIILDMMGMANIVISRDMAYKFVLCDKNDVKIGEWDNITAGGSGGYLPETIVVRVDGTEHRITSTASRDGDNRLIFTIDIDQDFLDRIDGIEDDIESLEQNKKDIVRQNTYTANGSNVKTIKKIAQDPNGEVEVEFEDIEFPQGAPDVSVVSPNNTISVEEEVEGNHKTIKIDVNGSGLEYGRFFAQNVVSGATLTKASGNLNVSSGKIQLKKGKSYHFTIRGAYKNNVANNTTDTLSFIEYTTSNSIAVNVDDTITSSQHFEISFDVYNLANDVNYSVAFAALTDAVINPLWVEVHSLGSSVSGGGGGGTEYSEGEAIKIENDEISVDYGKGLEVDPLTNKLQVKIGNGLKFDEESLSVEIDSDVNDVVELVEKLADDLDKKISTTYPFAQITQMADFADFGVTNTNRMVGQLFDVPITTEIREDDTLICVNALQSYAGNVSIGIFEFDFDANNGTGSTYWIADTGKVSIQAGENEFPIKHLLNDVNRPKIELMSSRLYYACICVDGAAPSTGLFLAACPSYGATYNALPLYTMKVSNLSVDWTTGNLSGTWFEGHNEDNTIPRMFMMIRNRSSVTPIPTQDPFTDIGQFTLAHNYRINQIFGNVIPDENGAVLQKIRPTQNVTITKFAWVDYRETEYSDTSYGIVFDEDLNAIVYRGDGSITNQYDEKIDGTHYYHEFTLTTPLQLQANKDYWFPAHYYTTIRSSYTDGGENWLIQYSSPNVTRDLQLVKSLWNVNQWINGNGNGEYKASQVSPYFKVWDNNGNSWVI